MYPITIRGLIYYLTKDECADLRQQLWDNYSWPLMVEMTGNNRVVISTVGSKKFYQFISPPPAVPRPSDNRCRSIPEPFPGAYTPWARQLRYSVSDDRLKHNTLDCLSELPNPPDVELSGPLLQAADQPMPEHLQPEERDEIDRLLLTVFRQDVDAIDFLTGHNAGLRARPLDLITRDRDGVQRVLAYLRSAAANHNQAHAPLSRDNLARTASANDCDTASASAACFFKAGVTLPPGADGA